MRCFSERIAVSGMMRQHVLRSRTTGVPGGAALQPTTSKGPTLAVGTAHGSGSVPFAGPQEAHHDPLQVNRNLTEKQGHDAEPASPETSTGRRAPPDRPTPPLRGPARPFIGRASPSSHAGLRETRGPNAADPSSPTGVRRPRRKRARTCNPGTEKNKDVGTTHS